VSMGWDTYAGVPCNTGNDPAGYLVVDGHVYAGQPGDPPTLKLALYNSNGGNGSTEPSGTPLCESDIVTIVPGDNLVPLVDCPVLAPSNRYYILFVAASPDTQIGDTRTRPCTRWHGRPGRHTTALDSISDPYPDADALPWLNDYCQETIWLDLASAGQ